MKKSKNLSTRNTELEQGRAAGEPIIRATRVSKEYLGGEIVALDDVSVDIKENQVTALIGPSGCGKTTLLRLISGLEYPTRGEVQVYGQPIQGPGPERGMVFQAYTSFPWLNVLNNVEHGMKIQGLPKEQVRERAQKFLKLVHLDQFAESYPIQLSGGMKQRVAIARALAQNPQLLLLDEPFGALDAQVTWEMEEMVIEIIEGEDKTIVLVTHDIQEAIYLADRIIFFTRQPGKIKADLAMDFKQGRRFLRKEDLLAEPGYVEMEKLLYQMMREEIQGARKLNTFLLILNYTTGDKDMNVTNQEVKKPSFLRRMRLAIAACLLAAFSLTTYSASAETVRVGHFSWPGYGFHYVAEANGLTDLKFENTILEDPVQLFSLLSTSQLDVVFSTIEFGPIAAAEDMGFKLTNLSNLAHGSDMIITHPDIKEPADLIGKQVAILEGGLSHIMMGIWLEQNGVNHEDVQMVNLIAGDAAAAMISGQVAAAELWSPFNAQVLADLEGSKNVAYSFDDYWLQSALIADGIYMSNDFLENNRATAIKTIQAIYAGVEHWRANSEPSNKIIAEAVGFSVEDVSAILGDGSLTRVAANNDPANGELYIYSLEDTARFCGVADGTPPFGQKNGQLKDHWELTNDWWIKFGFITNRGDYDKGTDCELVREALGS